MGIIWAALGIGAIVAVILFALAQQWQRTLREHSWALRRLTDRIQDLEEMADPRFRQRLSDSSPVPLEQVFTLSFRLDERFWRNALRLTEDDRRFISEFGSFVGSVKLERWRSHTVATVTEVLPDRKATGWQTRSLDFYPGLSGDGHALTLWELDLARPGAASERPPSLELVLRQEDIELRGNLCGASVQSNDDGSAPAEEDVVFFRVPLDTAELAKFRSPDPLDSPSDNGGPSGASEMAAGPDSWQAFYSDRNENLGIEWQLSLRDLSRKSAWERWKTLEYTAPPEAFKES